jgi:hypothetical protein
LAGCGQRSPQPLIDEHPGAEPSVGPSQLPRQTVSLLPGSSAAAPSSQQRPSSRPSPAPERQLVPRPAIVSKLIPYPAKRRAEMAAYSRRHYGQAEWRLAAPKVIVEHYTASQSLPYGYFAQDQPDPELHELPGICSHYAIDKQGTIYQYVTLNIRCRHTVGLNWTAIGIEHVGNSDAEVLGNRRQMGASLRLTRWLRCRYAIKPRNVIGHNESLSSPYHREQVARLRSQTHGDWTHASMERYRQRLGPGCR